MEVRKVILPSQLISKPGGAQERASYKINPCNFDGLDLRIHLGIEGENSIFLDRPEQGSVEMQEFWGSVEEKIYLDVNDKGELVGVFPKGFDGYINDKGELIVVRE